MCPSSAKSPALLLENPEDGRIKLYLIWKTLCLRRESPDIFQRGKYLPLAVEDPRANHIIAFLRKNGSGSLLAVAPRLVAGLLGDSDFPPVGSSVWGDTHVLLPFPGSFETYRNAFTGAVELLSVSRQEFPSPSSWRTSLLRFCTLGPLKAEKAHPEATEQNAHAGQRRIMVRNIRRGALVSIGVLA